MSEFDLAHLPELPPLDLFAVVTSFQKKLPRRNRKLEDASQDLYFEAMEAPTKELECILLKLALGLDSTNVDALLAFSHHCDMPLDEELAVMTGIVSIAARRLGKKMFKDYTGSFWGFHETRPYMRALASLAQRLFHAGMTDLAVMQWEEMLKLNPNDNQGMRYSLLAGYVMLNRLPDAQRLFARYDELDFNTVFAYGRVLERFLSGDAAGAETALHSARKQNPHSEQYLRDMRKRPKALPNMYSVGSLEEAACFADLLQAMWAEHTEARKWLTAQPPTTKTPDKRTPKKTSR